MENSQRCAEAHDVMQKVAERAGVDAETAKVDQSRNGSELVEPKLAAAYHAVVGSHPLPVVSPQSQQDLLPLVSVEAHQARRRNPDEALGAVGSSAAVHIEVTASGTHREVVARLVHQSGS